MKKIISLLLAITFVLTLSACDTADDTSSPANTSTPTQNEISSTVETSSEVTTSTETTTSTEETVSSTPTISSEPTTSSKPTEPSKPTHTHSFGNATCTEPKKCSCGVTEGEALGHKWTEATCTAPKTCLTCKQTEGALLEHTYVSGVCSVCSYADPEYIPLTDGYWEAIWTTDDHEYQMQIDFASPSVAFVKDKGLGDGDAISFVENGNQITVTLAGKELAFERVSNDTLKAMSNFTDYICDLQVGIEFKHKETTPIE